MIAIGLLVGLILGAQGAPSQAAPTARADSQAVARGSRAAPLVVELIPLAEDSAKRHDDTRRAEDAVDQNRRIANWTRVLGWATLALCLGTGTLAFFTFGLWNDAKKSAETQAQKMQASVDAANDATATMRQSLEESRLHNERQSRAYVVVEKAKLSDPGATTLLEWSFEVHNAGRIPAYNVRVSAVAEVAEPARGKWPDFPIPWEEDDKIGTIGPGRSFPSGYPVTGLNAQKLNDVLVRPMQWGVMLAITVHYDDAFQQDRCTNLLQVGQFMNGGWRWFVFPTQQEDS